MSDAENSYNYLLINKMPGDYEVIETRLAEY